MENELELLTQLYRRTLPEEELIDIFYKNRDRYRVLLQLLQQPRFPEKLALNIIPKLYPMDLIRVKKINAPTQQSGNGRNWNLLTNTTSTPWGKKSLT